MIRWLLISCAVIPGCFRSEATACRTTLSFQKGTVSLGETVAGAEIEVGVQTAEFLKGALHREGYFGLDVDVPRWVVSTIQLTVGERRLYIPLSAYGDLADPRDACLANESDPYRLVIRGGDASSSYEAMLEFDDRFLRKRRIFLREFPTQRWEETVYSFTESAE